MKKPITIAKGARKTPGPFSRIEDAVEAFRAGRMIIVVDDEDRENEGDLTIAAEKVTPDAINSNAEWSVSRYGSGMRFCRRWVSHSSSGRSGVPS